MGIFIWTATCTVEHQVFNLDVLVPHQAWIGDIVHVAGVVI